MKIYDIERIYQRSTKGECQVGVLTSCGAAILVACEIIPPESPSYLVATAVRIIEDIGKQIESGEFSRTVGESVINISDRRLIVQDIEPYDPQPGDLIIV
jgi:hypothetical protein